jgi:D-glycero-alpha-D-manno-heptose-7-phosphate kinase
MIITRTPLRISLLGGGTDYPTWFTKNGGLVVGGAIDKYCYVSLRKRPPFHEQKSLFVTRLIERVNTHAHVSNPVIRAALKYTGLGDDDAPGLEIIYQADLPARSGTGSSSSFVVGLLNTLYLFKGLHSWPNQLTTDAIAIEQKLLKETVGCQDQAWAAHGGLNSIHFRRSGDVNVYPLGISPTETEDLEKHLLLFFTGMARTSSEIAAEYAPQLTQKGTEQWALYRMAEKGLDAILAHDHQRLGWLVDQSWRIKCSLSPKVCPPEVGKAYAAARLAGAFGGKLTGAGGGGCLLLVAPREKHEAIAQVLPGYVRIPFRFDFEGSRVIFADRRAA